MRSSVCCAIVRTCSSSEARAASPAAWRLARPSSVPMAVTICPKSSCSSRDSERWTSSWTRSMRQDSVRSWALRPATSWNARRFDDHDPEPEQAGHRQQYRDEDQDLPRDPIVHGAVRPGRFLLHLVVDDKELRDQAVDGALLRDERVAHHLARLRFVCAADCEHAAERRPVRGQAAHQPLLLRRFANRRRQRLLEPRGFVEILPDALEGGLPAGERIRFGALHHVAHQHGQRGEGVLDAEQLQRVLAVPFADRRLLVAKTADFRVGVRPDPGNGAEPGHHAERQHAPRRPPAGGGRSGIYRVRVLIQAKCGYSVGRQPLVLKATGEGRRGEIRDLEDGGDTGTLASGQSPVSESVRSILPLRIDSDRMSLFLSFSYCI